MSCYHCEKDSHRADECKFKDAECHSCHKNGHSERACLQRKKERSSIGNIKTKVVNLLRMRDRQPIYKSVKIKGRDYNFQVDTGSPDNFCDQSVWRKLGRPKLRKPDYSYISAGDEPLKVLGKFAHPVQTDTTGKFKTVEFVVTKHPVNLLGLAAKRQLKVNVDSLLHATSDGKATTEGSQSRAITTEQQEAQELQKACQEFSKDNSDLFKEKQGCRKDTELEVSSKPDTKPRTVPIAALLDDLNQACEAGIKRGIEIPTQFTEYGTPGVPIALVPRRKRASHRVCGDFSVTVNHQLETHRHPITSPDAQSDQQPMDDPRIHGTRVQDQPAQPPRRRRNWRQPSNR